MVSFVCNTCQDTLKKNKLDSHKQRCRFAQFACVDCFVDFQGTEYRAHTSCITEEQKVQGKLYKPKEKKVQTPKKPTLIQQIETKFPKVDDTKESESAPADKVEMDGISDGKALGNDKIVRKAIKSSLKHTKNPLSIIELKKKVSEKLAGKKRWTLSAKKTAKKIDEMMKIQSVGGNLSLVY